MKEILCFAFSSSVIVNSNLFKQFQNYQLNLGYIGTSELKLTNFIKSKKEAVHMVFHHPDYINVEIINPMKLKFHAHVQVILISDSFQPAFFSLYQKYLFSAIITTSELNELKPHLIIDSIIKFGYFPNNHVSKQQWGVFSHSPKLQPLPDLTQHEQTILQYVCNGYSLNQISKNLNVSLSAVNKAVKNLKTKLKTSNTKEMITISIINHWVKITSNTFIRKHPFIT